jgi:hypothetical protein
MHAVASTLTLALLFSPASLSAQRPLVEPGARVRVTAPDFGIVEQIATYDGVRRGMLIVVADSTINVPLATVYRLEVQRRKGHPWRGAGVGFLGGALLGAVVGPTLSGDLSDGDKRIIAAGGLGLVGSLLGIGIGSAIKTERWEGIMLDQLGVSIVPQPGERYACGVSVMF